ncbi:recombinase family protein [Agromyces sp. G08B096]|uniref:Recombinase family protein n=1 Tax=Agromyces sp. G08B096 TaxID=3156399 RepID=A0AAU7W407_9MICO
MSNRGRGALQAAPERPTRAVLYLRQSTYREESVSLELQEAAARQYCERQGYDVVAVEADPGVSGRTFKRPAVLRTMGMVETGAADVIVLWKWSRLSRARLDWAIAVDKVESQGGRIESATEPADMSTSAGRLARGILAEFNAFESERIGEEWQRAIRSRQARGVPGTGGERFGYTRAAKDEYQPDAETGPLLTQMYDRAVAGESITSLARWLNRQGATTTAGGQWDQRRVRRVLDSGFGAGKVVARSNGHTDYLPGIHPAVVGEDVWQAYLEQRRLAPHTPQQNAARYPLTGILICGDCGSGMSATTRSTGDGRRQTLYACNRYQRFRSGGRFVTTMRERVEGWVRGEVEKLAAELEDTRAAEARMRRPAPVNDADAIARQVAAEEAKLTRLTIGWSEGTVPDEAYKLASARIQARRDSLLARQAERRRTDADDAATVLVVRSLAERWDRATPAELRALLAKLIRTVTVHPPVGATRAGATYSIVWGWE